MRTIDELIAEQEERLKVLRARKREQERKREIRDALDLYHLLIEYGGKVLINGHTLSVSDALESIRSSSNDDLREATNVSKRQADADASA